MVDGELFFFKGDSAHEGLEGLVKQLGDKTRRAAHVFLIPHSRKLILSAAV